MKTFTRMILLAMALAFAGASWADHHGMDRKGHRSAPDIGGLPAIQHLTRAFRHLDLDEVQKEAIHGELKAMREAVKPLVRQVHESRRELHGLITAFEFDEAAVAEAVTALWKRNKLPNKRVVLGTANNRLVVRRVDVPQMEDDELAESLPFQVQDAIPISVDEAVLDFVPLEQFTTPDGEPMMSILVVAIHREIVTTLQRVAQTAGIRLEAIDLQAFGLVRATFGIEPAIGNPLQAVIDIGANLTQVVIARGGVAEFVRLLPRGGDDFTEALLIGRARLVAISAFLVLWIQFGAVTIYSHFRKPDGPAESTTAESPGSE